MYFYQQDIFQKYIVLPLPVGHWLQGAEEHVLGKNKSRQGINPFFVHLKNR